MKKGFKLGINSQDNRVVHIDEVDEGFSYGVCPECMSPLIASNRNAATRKKDTYFRHKSESNCKGETLIHLWGKQVIADRQQVLGAEYKAIGKAKDLARKFHIIELLQSSESLNLSNTKLEKRLVHGAEFKIPDLLSNVVDSNKPLAIEIFVNSAVNDKKASFFVDKGLDCLEIDLSSLPPDLINSPSDFEQYVINEAPRLWVYCSRYSEFDSKAQEEAERKAKTASKAVSSLRDTKRTIKSQWRDDHNDFIRMVEAYMKPENQEKVVALYQSHLDKKGTISHSYRVWFDSHFGGILNRPGLIGG